MELTITTPETPGQQIATEAATNPELAAAIAQLPAAHEHQTTLDALHQGASTILDPDPVEDLAAEWRAKAAAGYAILWNLPEVAASRARATEGWNLAKAALEQAAADVTTDRNTALEAGIPELAAALHAALTDALTITPPTTVEHDRYDHVLAAHAILDVAAPDGPDSPGLQALADLLETAETTLAR